MNDEQCKSMFRGYLDQIRRSGQCAAYLPQKDFESMRDFIKCGNFTTTESTGESARSRHSDGKGSRSRGY